MRMFLVGMCDIFLLLYLTALAQVDARRISKITVKDYLALQQTGAELERERSAAQTRLAEREQELAQAQARLLELEALRSTLAQEKQKEELARSESEKRLSESEKLALERERAARALEEEVSKTRLKAGEYAAKLAIVEQARQQAEESAKAASSRAAEEQQRAEQEGRAAIQAREQAAEESRRAEAARQSAEESRQKAEESRRLAAEKQKAFDEALQAKAEAEKAQAESAQRAEQAERAQVSAQALRRQAEQDAELLKREAELARERARRAEAEAQMAAHEVTSIKQPAAYALSRNIKTRLVTLQAELVFPGTFGDTKKELRLSLLPVTLDGEKVVIVPLQQLLADQAAQDLKEVYATIEGRLLNAVYLSAGPQRMAAFVVPGDKEAVPALPPGPLSSRMPTLIAVRNGGRGDFSDRIRNLNEESFVFQRDRLSLQTDGSLSYLVQGFRGSYDFGEQLLRGDQIVDLNGSFLGVAIKDNQVVPVSALKGWERLELPGPLSNR